MGDRQAARRSSAPLPPASHARARAHARFAQGFPILRHLLGTQVVFAGFAVVCAVAWLFILKFVPETKGTSLEQAGRAPS